MAQLGTFGELVFEVSSRLVRSFDGFQQKSNARIESTEIIGREPIVQFLGPGEKTIGFAMRLSAQLGADPQSDYDRLEATMLAGTAAALVLGGKPFGGAMARWLIEDLSAEYVQWSGDGRPLWIDVSVSLRKYTSVNT
jgi:hypothetical protein